ncbi:hypothetical protein AEQ27_14485 [Frigoribacterium sp. RIT-PI-h]|nr:hypothetical protein AEQ27_14485 [Frigoribacterium sp. RIT-PI-h]
MPAPDSPSDDEVAASLRALVEHAAADLAAREARSEALARYKPARRIVAAKTAEPLEPAGRAWRLGVLLLGTDGRVFETGRITRAVTPTRSQHLSAQVEQRKAERRAAVRGQFAEGEVVTYAYEPVDLSTGALQAGEQRLPVRDGRALVRWGAAAGEVRDLAAYLAGRAGLR